MHGVAISIALAALLAGAASTGGAAAASHPAKRAAAQNAAFPTWSPDGKQIAFVYTKRLFSPSARYRIVRTSSKPGRAIHAVLDTTGECCYQLQWAADSRLLVNPNGGPKSVRVPGGKPIQLAFLSCGTKRNPWGCSTAGFILSPDHQYAAAAITFDPTDPHSSYGIGLVSLKPGQAPALLPSPLTAEENENPIIDAPLAFSPDGTQLVFRRASWDGWAEGPPALMAISLGGGDPVPLAQSGIPGASLVPSDAGQVQWSPDGTWVAYTQYGSTHAGQNLEVVPTSGAGTPRILATCSVESHLSFSWSPTSQSIAYECYTHKPPSGPLMTVRPDGTERINLMQGRNLAYAQDQYAGGPQWSPDGSRLLFLAQRPGGVVHVWTVRADGSHLTRRG